MEFCVLGPFEVRAAGRALALGGPKPRGLLALLLLHPREPVSAERIALALWGEDAPAGAAKTVQVHVSRLRRALGDDDVLVTTSAGYSIRPGDGELDAERFAQLVADGRSALDVGDAVRASSLLHEALALWRGPPLGDLESLPFAPPEVARLEEQRLAALELRIDADLAGGRHAELVAELAGLVQQHPWRERLHAQLMLALYRSGRQVDALDAYRRARAVLIDELGIEPGPELTALQGEILAQDPGLAAPVARNDGREGALPVPPNRTIGRARELAAITARLHETRLLTLTGPGGVGKTRLAIEAARSAAPQFSDGAWFVALAALGEAGEVPMAIVRAVGIVVLEGETAEDAVVRFLAGRNVLLVADNCEHLLGIAPFIGRVLEACPHVTMLATSREPLSLHAEERRPVLPLPGADAEELFAERTRARAPDAFEADDAAAIGEICRRVDGLPLAVELAAARCGLLSPAEIARRLEAALAVLGSGPRDAPARHQTLGATIDWSHELLSDEEKRCFAGFAAFTGGATVEAAEAVTAADLDTLDRLGAKSLLVRRREHGATRLAMLETIRAYALDRLAASPDGPDVRDRHGRYYRALAEYHGSTQATRGRDRKEHLRALDADIENVQAALEWALEEQHAEDALALCVALGEYWLMGYHYTREVESIDRALGLPGADAQPRLRALALCHRHKALGPLGRRDEQAGGLDDAEAAARRVGDPALLAHVLEVQATHRHVLERTEVAIPLADEAIRLARLAGEEWGIALAIATRAKMVDDAETLRADVERAARLLEQAGNIYDLAGLLADSAYAAVCLGRDRDANELVARAAPITRELDNRYMWMLLQGNIGVAALMTGDIDAADQAFREELRLGREMAVVTFATEGLEGLAAVAAAREELERTARLYGAAGAQRHGEPSYPVEERMWQLIFEPAQGRLGDEKWDAGVRDGAAMSHDDAVAYALAG